MNRYAIVLAAGQGTRMKSKLYKVMHPVMGKPMVAYAVDAALEAGVDQVVTVTGVGADLVQDYLGNKSQYVLQEEQLGTAHAVMQAKEMLAGKEGISIILSGDAPLISPETIESLLDYHEAHQLKGSILTAHEADPYGYGRVIRNQDGTVAKIVEEKDASPEEKQVQEINTGTYCFDNQALFQALDHVSNDNAQGEYYLPDVIEILKNQGDLVGAYQMDDNTDALGVNDRVALSRANTLMRRRINQAHMKNGVSLIDPESTYIDVNVTIGQDTVIEPGVYLKGETEIGQDAHIGAHSIIEDSQLGDGVVIKQSTIEEAIIGPNSDIGPNSHLRPGAILQESVHVGNYVEIKKSLVKSKAKLGHHAYVGDAEVGQGVNVSCGVIFANYDGKDKHRSVIGDYAFIGSNVTIVSPVTVEAGAFLAAGSTITEDVKQDSLAIARSRQVNKDGYTKNKDQGWKRSILWQKVKPMRVSSFMPWVPTGL